MGEGCKRLWQAFSKGRRDILQQSCSGGHGCSWGRTRVPTPSTHGQSRGLDSGFLTCPWRISLLQHLCPPGNTMGQEQERLLSSFTKVEPDLMM